MSRARLTPVDVVYVGMSVATLVFVALVFYSVLEDAPLGTGTGYLFQMVVPGLIMTLLVIIYAVGVGGSS